MVENVPISMTTHKSQLKVYRVLMHLIARYHYLIACCVVSSYKLITQWNNWRSEWKIFTILAGLFQLCVKMFLAFALLFLWLFYKWLMTNSEYFKKIGVPYEKPLPLFGNALGLLLKKQSFIDLTRNSYYNFKNSSRWEKYIIVSSLIVVCFFS